MSVKKSSKTKPSFSTRTIGFIIVIMLIMAAFIFFIGYKWYKSQTNDNYAIQLQKVEEPEAKKLAKLSWQFEQFYANPKAAKYFEPKFKKASQITNTLASKINEIAPLKNEKVNHQKLVLYYQQSSTLYKDLANLCGYIKTRSEIINKLIKDLGFFAGQIKKQKKNEEVAKIAGKTANNLRSVIKQLKTLKTPIKIFNNDKLITYTANLSSNLTALNKNIQSKNFNEAYNTIYDVQVAYAQDWQQAFVDSDKKSIRSYNKRVNKIQNLYKQITSQ